LWKVVEKSLQVPHLPYLTSLNIAKLHSLLPTLSTCIPFHYLPLPSFFASSKHLFVSSVTVFVVSTLAPHYSCFFHLQLYLPQRFCQWSSQCLNSFRCQQCSTRLPSPILLLSSPRNPQAFVSTFDPSALSLPFSFEVLQYVCNMPPAMTRKMGSYAVQDTMVSHFATLTEYASTESTTISHFKTPKKLRVFEQQYDICRE